MRPLVPVRGLGPAHTHRERATEAYRVTVLPLLHFAAKHLDKSCVRQNFASLAEQHNPLRFTQRLLSGLAESHTWDSTQEEALQYEKTRTGKNKLYHTIYKLGTENSKAQRRISESHRHRWNSSTRSLVACQRASSWLTRSAHGTSWTLIAVGSGGSRRRHDWQILALCRPESHRRSSCRLPGHACGRARRWEDGPTLEPSTPTCHARLRGNDWSCSSGCTCHRQLHGNRSWCHSCACGRTLHGNCSLCGGCACCQCCRWNSRWRRGHHSNACRCSSLSSGSCHCQWRFAS